MKNTHVIALALMWSACGGPSDLSVDEVQNIPDGDASGTELTGSYDVELRVVDCSGSCGPFSVGIFSASVCDVGDVDSGTIELTQDGGHLRITTDDLPSFFEGGAFSDGTFDVGGYATQFGGDLQITARAEGSLGADGRLDATVRSRSWGDVEGNSADCVGVREITGSRR